MAQKKKNKRMSHETQAIQILGVIDPDALLGGQRPEPEAVSVESLLPDALEPGSEGGLDGLFQESLPRTPTSPLAHVGSNPSLKPPATPLPFSAFPQAEPELLSPSGTQQALSPEEGARPPLAGDEALLCEDPALGSWETLSVEEDAPQQPAQATDVGPDKATLIEVLPKATLLEALPKAAAARPTRSPLSPSPSMRHTILPQVRAAEQKHQFQTYVQPRYEELKSLYRTAHCTVTLARDNDLQRLVTLKTLDQEHHSPYPLTRFLEEIHHIGQLNHPGVAPIHDVGVDTKGRYYYACKYVGGEGLDSIIARLAAGDKKAHQAFPISRRIGIVIQLLHTLQFAHAQGILHCHLQPSQVTVGPYGDVELRGWELARQIRNRPRTARVGALPDAMRFDEREASLQVESLFECIYRYPNGKARLTGTPAYMSPEQLQGLDGQLDEGSDLYSLCVLFYEFLTLRHPFEGHTRDLSTLWGAMEQEQIEEAERRAPPLQGALPKGLSERVMRGLRRRPEERYGQAEELLAELHELMEGKVQAEAAGHLAARWTGALHQSSLRRPTLSLLGLGSLLALASAGLLGIFYQLWRLWAA